jgi:hypothetical protein
VLLLLLLLQWWWPESKPEKQDCVWTEIAIRLLDPSAEEFELQVCVCVCVNLRL